MMLNWIGWKKKNFNTSHVSINPKAEHEKKLGKAFQYISCFY